MLDLELISPCLTGSTNEVYGSLGVLDLELVNGFLIGSTRAGQVCHFWQVGLGADLWTKHMNGVRHQCVFLHELVCVCASVGWRHVFGQYLLKLRCARSCLVLFGE